MDQVSKAPIMPRALVNDLISQLYVGIGGNPAIYGTLTVHLYSAQIAPPGPLSVVADFTECNFPGYAAFALPAVVGPFNLNGNNGSGLIGQATFLAAAITVSQNAIGYWVNSPDSPSLIVFAEQFPNPTAFVNPGDLLALNVILPQPFRIVTGE